MIQIADRQTIRTIRRQSVGRRPMVFLALLIEILLLQSSAADQMAFPFDGYVTRDSEVRSGPGDAFYKTSKIQDGAQVTVYHLTPGGWYAIRPQDDSFSWIRRDQVATTDRPDVVRVISPGAFSRVGSQQTDIRNVRSVNLQVGELLAVKDSETLNEKWIKIQPPAGEFRWIHRDQVRRIIPSQNKSGDALSGKSNPDATSTTPLLLTKGIIDLDPPARMKGKMVTEPIPVEPEPLKVPATAVAITEPRSDQEVIQTSAWVAMTDSTLDQHEAIADDHALQPTPNLVAPVDFGQQLGRINAELSKIVATEQQNWNFGQVERKAKAIVDFAKDERYVLAARKLLRRIHEFEAIKLDVANLNTPPGNSLLTGELGPPENLRRDNRVRRAAFDSNATNELSIHEQRVTKQRTPRYHQFDGYGWLMPVYSTRRGLPKFALTNRQGTILAFVSPNAGMNLRPYLKKRVGLIGRRESRPIQQKPHLSVARVVVLDKKSR